ncbi:MAG: PAS domain S-box protein [Bacteroidetes bacterium]|nr:PAS domain S-box protein [Bacteroidota bacterium]MBP6426226.1 PAS domain S-box protein [Bacteroidia bacterium]MBP9789942.1 PAS domain S-box protein [Bacteroidia bacterium]
MKGKEKYLLLLFLAILIAGISIYTNPNWKEQIFIIAIVILTSVFVLIDLFSVRKRTTQDREAFEAGKIRQMAEQIEKYKYLASIAKNIQDPIISSDKNYTITEWNPAAERLFGWKSEEAIGKTAMEVLKIKFHTGGREEALAAFEKEGFWQGEVIYYTKENVPLNVLVTVSQNLNDNSEVVGNLVLVKDISSLKKAEIELQELNASLERLVEERTNELNKREQRFKYILEYNDSLIIVIDKDRKMTYRSPSAERVTGWTDEDSEQIDIFQRIHPDDLEKVNQVFNLALANPGAPFKITLRSKHKNNSYIWFDGIIVNLFHEPNVQGMLTNFKDITEIKEAEQELIKSEKRFKALVGNAEDIISLIDEKGKVIYVSPAFEKATGYTVDYMVGKNFSEIMHPENIYDSKNIFSELLLHPGKLFHRQNRFRHKDGHHFWVEGTVINLLNDENVKAIVANHRDVSDKFKSRDTAIEMNERFSIVSKATHDVVWDWNLITNEIWWNENFYTLFGYDKDETEQKFEFWIKNIDDNDRERVEKKIFESIKNGEMFWTDEYKYHGGNGKVFFILDRGSIIRNLEGEPIRMIGSMVNLTPQKIAEEKEKKYVEELERSNKELEQFAYIASHDLQEPLRMVGSYVQLIEQRYKGRLDEDADEFIKYAVDGANRMKQLIIDLLNYSKINRQLPDVEVDLNTVVKDVLENLKTIIVESKTEIKIDELPVILADKTQMIQVFQNLLANAVKFQVKDNIPEIRISAERKTDEWLFSVKDNGIGIDKKYHDKVFVIFKQLHSKAMFNGTGIGLAVVKKIVERHGGTIWFESELGKGTTFYFTLKVKKHESS